jgi:hypothetical protein
MQKSKKQPESDRGDLSTWQLADPGPRPKSLPRLLCWVFLVTTIVLEAAWLAFLAMMAIWAHR